MKKLLVVLVSILMVLAVAGCSSSNSGDEGSNETPVVKIGGSGPLTGDYAQYGQAIQNGATLAIEEINAKGGMQFALNFQDDQGDPDMAESAFGALMDWGMQVSLSTTTSGAAIRVSPLYQENQIFAMTPSGSNPLVTLKDANDENSGYGNVFQMCFTDPNQGSLSADYISQNGLGTKAYVIYEDDIDYSTSIESTFVKQAANIGLEVVGEYAFKNADTDFSNALTDAKSLGADVIFLPIYYSHATFILNTVKDMDYSPIFFGVDGMDGILGQENFDASIAEGVYLLTPFSTTAEVSKDFTAKYESKFGSTPNQFAADAYDTVYAIAAAMEKAGLDASASAQDICTALVGVVTSADFSYSGLTGTSTWNKNGTVTKIPMAVVIHDGTYVDAK